MYFLCDFCAHYWSEPDGEFPDRCEHCRARHGWIVGVNTLEQAEEASEGVLESIAELHSGKVER